MALEQTDLEQITSLLATALKPFGDQVTALGATVDTLKKAQPPAAPPAAPPVTPPAQPPAAPPAVSPELNSQLLEFKRKQEESDKKLADLEKARADAEKRAQESEKKSAVDAALNGFTFPTPEARQTAFEKVSSEVKRMDDGTLVAGDNLTPEAFVKDFLPSKHAYLLAPDIRGGSGNGASYTHGANVKVATTEMIKDGMTADDRAAVVARITEVVNAHRS